MTIGHLAQNRSQNQAFEETLLTIPPYYSYRSTPDFLALSKPIRRPHFWSLYGKGA